VGAVGCRLHVAAITNNVVRLDHHVERQRFITWRAQVDAVCPGIELIGHPVKPKSPASPTESIDEYLRRRRRGQQRECSADILDDGFLARILVQTRHVIRIRVVRPIAAADEVLQSVLTRATLKAIPWLEAIKSAWKAIEAWKGIESSP
jgi:hypothetical protein